MNVSIIVPIYNAENYLKRCIESVLSCDNPEIELILVNDGSLDSSGDICRQYEKKDIRIQYIESTNKGVSAARNIGIKAANNQFIMFLDADDYLVDGFNKILCFDSDFIGFSFYTNKNGVLKLHDYPIDHQEISMTEVKRVLLGTDLLHTCWGKVFKKSIIDNYNVFFDESVTIGEDYLFVMEYFKRIDTAKLINRPVLCYCINPDSVMNNYKMALRYQTWKLLIGYCYRYCIDNREELLTDFANYQFRCATDYMKTICTYGNISEKKDYIFRILWNNVFNIVLSLVDQNRFNWIKRFELRLIKSKKKMIIINYFTFKSIIGRLICA